ncbi:MAG: hypothetical protein IT292_05725 [Deltaproteobacteria bacterium]|nr:hypothetical protein [Deltaproteobacteria bacterium]
MIFRLNAALESYLNSNKELKPMISKIKAKSLWGDWFCGGFDLECEFEQPTNRAILAINSKTLFSVFFPFDALGKLKYLSPLIFFNVSNSLTEHFRELNCLGALGPDIAKDYYFKLTDEAENAKLNDLANRIDNFLLKLEKKSKKEAPVFSLPVAIRDINFAPRQELGGRSPLELALELFKEDSFRANKTESLMI